MDYGMIGKIEKAKRYAQQLERIHFDDFSVTMEGENNPHVVRYNAGTWQCDCDFFHSPGRCSHTMAMEMVLNGMVIKHAEPVAE